VFGLGLGSVYVLLGNGIVLIYRGSGVLNFAHGAFAMASAYLYYELYGLRHWAFLPTLVVCVVFSALIGVLTNVLVMRPLRHASPLARLIANARRTAAHPGNRDAAVRRLLPPRKGGAAEHVMDDRRDCGAGGGSVALADRKIKA
jgi:hypothetical protein